MLPTRRYRVCPDVPVVSATWWSAKLERSGAVPSTPIRPRCWAGWRWSAFGPPTDRRRRTRWLRRRWSTYRSRLDEAPVNGKRKRSTCRSLALWPMPRMCGATTAFATTVSGWAERGPSPARPASRPNRRRRYRAPRSSSARSTKSRIDGHVSGSPVAPGRQHAGRGVRLWAARKA